jgi:hypothetical protein
MIVFASDSSSTRHGSQISGKYLKSVSLLNHNIRKEKNVAGSDTKPRYIDGEDTAQHPECCTLRTIVTL